MKILIEHKVPAIMIMTFFAFLINAFTYSGGGLVKESSSSYQSNHAAKIIINYDK